MACNIDCTDPEMQKIIDVWAELGCQSFVQNEEQWKTIYEEEERLKEQQRILNRQKSMHKLPKGMKKYF